MLLSFSCRIRLRCRCRFCSLPLSLALAFARSCFHSLLLALAFVCSRSHFRLALFRSLSLTFARFQFASCSSLKMAVKNHKQIFPLFESSDWWRIFGQMQLFIRKQKWILARANTGHEMRLAAVFQHAGPTHGRTDGWMDGRMDRPSFRDARTHLKTRVALHYGLKLHVIDAFNS